MPAPRLRLSAMMFLQYFIPGTFLPILSLYCMQHLAFTPAQVGVVFAMPAIGAIFSPYLVSQIADRYLSAERLLTVCDGLSALLMVVLAQQTSFWPFICWYFVYAFVASPTIALSNAVALHHLEDARRDFGAIRVWGTAGWVAAAWVFGYFYLNFGGDSHEKLPHALYAAAASSVVMAVFALSLPRSHVKASAPPVFLPWKVFHSFARPSLIVLLVSTVLMGIANQFYFVGTSPMLSDLGLRDEHIMPALSMGQICELFTVGFSGYLLVRFGIKAVLAFAIITQALRFLLFATLSMPLVMTALTFQGFTFLFYTTAFIYVDMLGRPEERAGMQQLYGLMMSGCGNFAGSLVAGWTGTALTHHGQMNYPVYWLFPAGISVVAAVGFLMAFREESLETEPAETVLATAES